MAGVSCSDPGTVLSAPRFVSFVAIPFSRTKPSVKFLKIAFRRGASVYRFLFLGMAVEA
jgi:hypothetical protein